MALDSNNTWWAIYPSTGDDNNGGAFISTGSGTDFSLQGSAQQVYTDLVAVTGTTISSVARAFSSVDVGNVINITSGTGWTTGRYQINSVVAGVATVDRTIATASSTGGHGNYGGALKLYNTFQTITQALTITAANAKVKAEATITITTRPDFQSITSLQVIGFTSTYGDNGKVSMTTSNGTDNLTLFRGTGVCIFRNFAFSDTSGTRHNALNFVNGFNYLIVSNCTFDGHSIAINWNSLTIVKAIIRQVEIKNCTGAGISVQICNDLFLDDCWIHGNAGNGLDILATASQMAITVNRCAFYGNAINLKSVNDGAAAAGSLHLLNSVFVHATSDNIKHVGTGTNNSVITYLQNCIIYDSGGFGINVASTTQPVFNNLAGFNGYGSNTSGDRNNFPAQTGDVALSADPFTSSSTGDFSLNSNAGGGALLKAVGFPASFP